MNFLPTFVEKFAKPTRKLPPWSRRHWRLALCGSLLLTLLVLRSDFQWVIVKGESMSPTFQTGDLLLVDKRAYRATEPQRADIVVARSRNELIVKRVVGLPGEEVEVQNGSLFINGIRSIESHPIQPGELTIEKGKLRDGRFALLGDNRALQFSQPIHALVSQDDIIGKVIFSIKLSWLWPAVERST